MAVCDYLCFLLPLLIIDLCHGACVRPHACGDSLFTFNTLTTCAPVCLQEYEYDYEDYEELQPLNCSTTETIKNGQVTYSQVKKKKKKKQNKEKR